MLFATRNGTPWDTDTLRKRKLYEELPEPQYSAEREHARRLLGKRYRWWQNALGERQLRLGEDLITPLFFRIHIDSMSGLRAVAGVT